MKTILQILILATTLFISTRAHAESVSNLSMGVCSPMQIQSQNSDGVVAVTAAVICNNMYSVAVHAEVTIQDLAYDKALYIYDRTRTYQYERAIVGKMVNSSEIHYTNGGVYYLGKTSDGKDRFAVTLLGQGNHGSHFDIYVKMNGNQYQTTSVILQ